jgi:hypothetical protein
LKEDIETFNETGASPYKFQTKIYRHQTDRRKTYYTRLILLAKLPAAATKTKKKRIAPRKIEDNTQAGAAP